MKLETVDYLADDAAQQFVTSLRETGFGVLKTTQSLKSWWSLFTKIGTSFSALSKRTTSTSMLKHKTVIFHHQFLKSRKATQ